MSVEPDPTDLRAEARRRVQRIRALKLHIVASAIGMLVLTAVWAITEYHNAGGWPHSFSQSSGTSHIWNDWIIWPALAWALFTGFRVYVIYFHRPTTEADVDRELARMKGALR
jgi:2TM domain